MNMTQRQDILDSNLATEHDIEMEDGEDEAFMRPPPGAEGAHHSHAGDEDLVSELGEGMRQRPAR